MKKIWKIGLLLGIFAFLAGCSNLWDYQPPKNNNPKPQPQEQPPLKPLSQGGNSVDKPLDAGGLQDALSDGGFTDDGGKLVGDDGAPVAGSPFAGKAPTGKPVLDGLLVKNPDGTTKYLPLGDDGTLDVPVDLTIPKGSTIDPIFREADNDVLPFKVKVTGADGQIYEIPVEVPDGATKAKWSEIKAAADGLGIKLIPDGYTLDKLNGNTPNDNTEFNKDDEITLTLTKNGPEPTRQISYTVKDAVGKEITVKIDVPQSQASTGVSLQDIINEAKKQPGTNFGDDYITIDSWTKDGGTNTVGTSDKIAPNAVIQPKERTAKYYVTKKKATESNPHPTPETVQLKLAVDATGNKWNDILTKTTGGSSSGFDTGRVNGKWTYEGLDGVSKLDPIGTQDYAPGTHFSAVYLTMKLPNRDDWGGAADKFDAHKLPTTQWALKTANGEYVYVIFADEYVPAGEFLAENSFIYLYYGLSTTSMEEAVKKALIAKAYEVSVMAFNDPNMQTGFAAFTGSFYGDEHGADESTAVIMTDADQMNPIKSAIYGLYNINSDGDLIKSGDATEKYNGNMMALQNIYFKVSEGVIDTDDFTTPPTIDLDNVVPFERPPYWKLRYDLDHIVIVDSSDKYISAEAQTVTCASAKEWSSPNFERAGAVPEFPTIDGVPADVGTGAVSVGTGASTDNYTAADFKGWVNIDDLPNEGETVTLITNKWNKNAHATLVAVFQKR